VLGSAVEVPGGADPLGTDNSSAFTARATSLTGTLARRRNRPQEGQEMIVLGIDLSRRRLEK